MSDTTPPKPDGPMSQDAFRALCLMYHANEIDEAGFAALTAELDASATRRSLFVEVSMQIETICEAFEQKGAEQTAVELGITDDEEDVEDEDAFDIMTMVVDQALALRRQHEIEDEANHQLAAQQQEDARNRRFELCRDAEPAQVKRVIVIPRIAVVGVIAATILLVAGVVFEASKNDTADTLPPPQDVVESPSRQRVETPTVYPVASLLDARQPVWGEQGAWPQIGGGLLPGQYELVSGAVQVEFDSGATILVEGPARFELVDDNAGRLELGSLTAYVPHGAQGFTISTPGTEFVDLGTEFGIRLSENGDIQSHVFVGEVLATASSQQGPGSTILLREEEGLAVVDGVMAQQPQPAGFIRRLDDADYRAEITGDVEQVFATPASLEMDRYQCDGVARLIVESRGVELRGDERLSATLTRPGQMQHPPQPVGLNFGSAAVDSYLLHFNVASELPLGTEQTVTGEITFPRPVLAVQCGLEELRAGDAIFGVSGTRYHIPDSSRGWYGGPIEQAIGDWVWLSEDRRTIRFQTKAHNFDQCRILIEAARPRETDR